MEGGEMKVGDLVRLPVTFRHTNRFETIPGRIGLVLKIYIDSPWSIPEEEEWCEADILMTDGTVVNHLIKKSAVI